MSVKIMGLVWEKDLPFNKAWALMAMADHADHEGNNVFPSLELIAWKTGYSGRQIRRIIADLRDDGILKPYGHTPGGVVIYRIELAHIADKAPLQKQAPHRPKGRRENLPREPMEGEDKKRGGQIDTPFYGLHNHQSLLSNSKGREVTATTLSNSKCNRETDFDFENLFPDDF